MLALGLIGREWRPNEVGGEDRVRSTLLAAAETAREIWTREPSYFQAVEPRLRFVSPLTGPPEIYAAEAALDLGFELEVMLPGPRERHLAALRPELRGRIEPLLDRADVVLELGDDDDESTVGRDRAGQAMMAQVDLLLAVWDGSAAVERGDTGEVVETAFRRGLPVAHVRSRPDVPARLLWSGFDVLGWDLASPRDVPSRPLSAETLSELLAALLLPPADPEERRRAQAFFGERQRRVRLRPEYPLLLAITGVRPLSLALFHEPPYLSAADAEWRALESRIGTGASGLRVELGELRAAYAWSDRLADHCGQTYRSGHVLNFIFAAAAVVIALSSLLLPAQLKQFLTVSELLVIVVLVANTQIGSRLDWHRRWLDYRHLAEQLRPMRSLKLLGLAAPSVAPSRSGRPSASWIEWYAAALWRQMRAPSGRHRPDTATDLARLIAEEEFEPQIAYHRANARRMERLDHRLHTVGNALFMGTILACVMLIYGLAFLPEWTKTHTNPFIVFSAGLPAFGTALFGIRVQGDFAGTAHRSEITAQQLEALKNALNEPGLEPSRIAAVLERAVQFMLTDLSEWRLVHQRRKLVIPA